jgi:TonB family protein
MAVDDQLKVSSDGLLPAGESIRGPVKPGVYDPPEIAGEGISPAGDVWSLGVTVVEALTQRPPVWNGTEQTGAVLPEILPDPFVDIAHHCLQSDPQRRWTVADIAARLQQTSAPPREHKSANPPGAFQRRYVLPAAALGLALAGILAVPALRNRRPQSHVASPALLDEASVRTGSELKPVTPEAVETARGSDKQPASLATDGAGRLQSKVEAKTGAGGLVAGKVVHQVLPGVAPKASDTIQGKVRVRLRISVDPSGNVAYAKLDSPGPSRYFADLALHAAQRWRFDPAKVDGRPVTSEWILRFEFAKTGAKAFPVQTAP